MRFALAVDMLANLQTVADGDALITAYAMDAPAGVQDPEGWARRDLGWLTGELDWQLRDNALKCMPTVSHPVFGRRTGPFTPDQMVAFIEQAVVGGEGHPLGDRALLARSELGFDVKGEGDT
jgi:hypothetical protein